jgi:hypothetical protein
MTNNLLWFFEISQHNLCPPEYRGKFEDMLIAAKKGAEKGISPLESLYIYSVKDGQAVEKEKRS